MILYFQIETFVSSLFYRLMETRIVYKSRTTQVNGRPESTKHQHSRIVLYRSQFNTMDTDFYTKAVFLMHLFMGTD